MSLSAPLVTIGVLAGLHLASCGSSRILSDISVDLGITLCAFKINSTLLCQFLVARLLPFGEPAFRVWHRTWVLRVKAFRQEWLSLALLRDVNACTSTNVLDIHVGRFLDFLGDRHGITDQLLDDVCLIVDFFIFKWRYGQTLLHLLCSCKVHIC